MSLLDKIKGMFLRDTTPDETKLLLTGVENVSELRRGLDEIITRNEVERKECEREIDKLEKIELGEKDKVKQGGLSEREKMNTLRYVKRLRQRMDSFQKRYKIHEDNVDLHQGILDKIDEMEAMELKAVKQGQIEEIETDYEERRKEHEEIVATGKSAQEPKHAYEDVGEKRELEALEKEILAEDGKVPEAAEEEDEDLEDEDEDEGDELEEPVEATPVENPVAEKPVAEKAEPVKEEPRRAPLTVEPEKKDAESSPVKVPNERRVELE